MKQIVYLFYQLKKNKKRCTIICWDQCKDEYNLKWMQRIAIPLKYTKWDVISRIKWIYKEVLGVFHCQNLVSTTHGKI